MKKSAHVSNIGVCCLVVLVVGLVVEVQDVTAVSCNPMELSPCLGAFTGGGQPSPQCCGKLREQEPCLCDYIRNPSYRPYVGSSNAKKVAAACRVTIPNC